VVERLVTEIVTKSHWYFEFPEGERDLVE